MLQAAPILSYSVKHKQEFLFTMFNQQNGVIGYVYLERNIGRKESNGSFS